MKTCINCNKSKAEDEYEGNRNQCKKCRAEYKKKWAEKNPNYGKKWRENNREKCRALSKRWRGNNREKVRATNKRWDMNNRETCRASVTRWRENNREKCRVATKRWRKNNPDYHKQWYEKNPEKVKLQSKKRNAKPSYKIQKRLKMNFKNWLFKGRKSARTESLVGCILQVCILWIEAQFLPGMTWENYGAWHIDHMLPWEHFNLLDEGTHHKVMHYTNLQPLWRRDNEAKGSKIIYDMEWRNTWYIHTGTEYVCRKIQVENKINISVKPIVESFHGFAHAFATT